jgi:hypothetical protein
MLDLLSFLYEFDLDLDYLQSNSNNITTIDDRINENPNVMLKEGRDPAYKAGLKKPQPQMLPLQLEFDEDIVSPPDDRRKLTIEE